MFNCPYNYWSRWVGGWAGSGARLGFFREIIQPLTFWRLQLNNGSNTIKKFCLMYKCCNKSIETNVKCEITYNLSNLTATFIKTPWSTYRNFIFLLNFLTKNIYPDWFWFIYCCKDISVWYQDCQIKLKFTWAPCTLGR